MGVPSTVKFKKGNVVFESNVDRANYTIDELTRAALKDVGRFILRECAKEVRSINAYLKKSKYATKRYQMWVRKKENYLDLGIENTKFGAESAWWADQAELGTHRQPKRGILRNAVYQNIETIRKIEAQYLSAVDDDIKAQQLIDENEAQEEADENARV